MRAEISALVDDIKQAIALLRRHLDWDAASKRLDYLNSRAEDPDLWNDPDEAQKLMQERQRLEEMTGAIKAFDQNLADSVELIAMGEEEGDQDTVTDAEEIIKAMQGDIEKMSIEALLSGELDSSDTFVEVHSGAGGTESQDWASMLFRMYSRWAERRGFKVELQEYSAGDEAGIKSATILVKGHNAYGWLKTETGVHRLVRISPFDSNDRRHTSFSSVGVYPVIDDNIEVEVLDKDIRIDTFRSSGAGGQHVNTTDSAVRITHFPTGIVVTSSEKSQHQNRANCMKALRARLYDMEMKKREDAAAASHDGKTDIGWGHQIRSYVMQPYQLVKDLRTGVESTAPQDVLDGALDPFMEAALAARVDGAKGDVDDLN
ncbi:peptide chain release factor 2 [Ahrensia sp. 13_GOM-1096m]|uniref:peptide chain release factor 2 n=1 Tax=Ahrensia sp. 13_GOM-1096m TaxID=1380380 RepID=UPI0012DF1B99|nr:peptide chain release factor 2 [Ahrensia sp. 13_GOM-1096m]